MNNGRDRRLQLIRCLLNVGFEPDAVKLLLTKKDRAQKIAAWGKTYKSNKRRRRAEATV
jgi:DNA-binding transcriptional MerR regulator